MASRRTKTTAAGRFVGEASRGAGMGFDTTGWELRRHAAQRRRRTPGVWRYHDDTARLFGRAARNISR